MIKAYIACSYVDRDLYEHIYSIVTGLGIEVTYRWVDHEPPPSGAERHMHRREQSESEINGVCAADILIVGLPGRFGTATEIGVALANEIPVILFGKLDRDFVTGDPANIFLDHPLVQYCSETPSDLREDITIAAERIILSNLAHLVRLQLTAPYDSWSSTEYRESLKRWTDAYDRLEGV